MQIEHAAHFIIGDMRKFCTKRKLYLSHPDYNKTLGRVVSKFFRLLYNIYNITLCMHAPG